MTEGGGGAVGEVVTVEVPGRSLWAEVYATDPEGNIIELRNYARYAGLTRRLENDAVKSASFSSATVGQ